jgi:hypothetical protein
MTVIRGAADCYGRHQLEEEELFLVGQEVTAFTIISSPFINAKPVFIARESRRLDYDDRYELKARLRFPANVPLNLSRLRL